MNSTGDKHIESDLSTGVKVLFVSMYVILTIGTFFGNLLVMGAFCKFANLRKASNSILVSLSAADTFMVIAFILRISSILDPKPPPHDVCAKGSMISLAFSSIIILHLALISVERAIAVKFALRYHTIVTNRRALIACIVVWLWGIGVSTIFPESFKADGYNTFGEFLLALTPCKANRRQIKPSRILQSESVRAYLIFLVVALLVIPITIIVFSYSYISNVAYKQRRQISREEDNLQVGKLAVKREMKGARTVAIVVGLCLASFVPLLVILCLNFLTSTTVSPHYMYGAYAVASVNACWNPLIYCWRNEDFRRSFKRLLKCNRQ